MTKRLDVTAAGVDIVVVVPCLNEETTIGQLVLALINELPLARVVVVDNASDDATAAVASASGAEVMRVARRGKGNAIRSAFSNIEADIYVMIDGDGTYDPAEAPKMIRRLIHDRLDMVVGARKGINDDAGRFGHAIGNRLFNWLYSSMFGRCFNDIFSGYRVFSRRFVRSFPALSSGFEIEAEMSVHAQMLRLPIEEIEVRYGRRPTGSSSKLSTHRDGLRILWMLFLMMKEVKPFVFFSMIGLASLVAGTSLGIPIIFEFFQTGLVQRLPTWLLAIGLGIVSVTMFLSGIILDSIARGRLEQKMLYFRSVPACQYALQGSADEFRLGESYEDATLKHKAQFKAREQIVAS